MEIPEFFICPISLQIMKDPVTAATGITYDRESIEQWLFKGHNTICPVTKQTLPRDYSELTPNHTLRRLIQAWCAIHEQISCSPRPPSPHSLISKFHNKNNIINLIRDLWLPNNSQLKALKELQTALTLSGNEKTRKHVVESGVAKPILSIVVTCYRKRDITGGHGLLEALSILYLIRSSLMQSSKLVLIEDDDEEEKIVEALIWVLSADHVHDDHSLLLTMKSNAASALKIVIQKANSRTLERLKPEFFGKIVSFLRELGKGKSNTGDQGTTINAALHVLLDSSPWGRNRMMMVEAGTIFELIELEINNNNSPEKKKTTELILGVLFHLCSCADGRAQFLSHAAGLALIARRILKVSPAADDRAILILSLICKFSPTTGVLQEMLRVGAVAKLCMVIQANCAFYLKDRAREILRNHKNVWKNSSCVEIAALTSNKLC